MSMLTDLKPGEVLRLDGPADITLEEKKGSVARLRIHASPEVKIQKSPDKPAIKLKRPN